MGTNYYAHIKTCPTYKRPDEEIHIGKSSCGWQFLLSPVRQSWAAWKAFLISDEVTVIKDEYGRDQNKGEFLAFVESKQDQPNHWSPFEDRWKYERLDDEGFRINLTEGFS